MEPYQDAGLQVTEALKEHVRYNLAGYEVEKLLAVRRKRNGQWECKVKWWGFGVEEASWEDIGVFIEDVPLLVEDLMEQQSVPPAWMEYEKALMKAGKIGRALCRTGWVSRGRSRWWPRS